MSMNIERFRRVIVAVGLLAGALTETHAQDLWIGQHAFATCAACHSTDGSVGIGPSLKGIVGRRAGSYPGFRYSRAMNNAGRVWDAGTLEDFLLDPQKAVPGNGMPSGGIQDTAQRAQLIAYLQTLK